MTSRVHYLRLVANMNTLASKSRSTVANGIQLITAVNKVNNSSNGKA